MTMDVTTDPFWRLEHEGWERAAEAYSRSCGLITSQFVAPLLAAATRRPGLDLLDAACGPGYLTAEAVRGGANAIGFDFSADVIQRARASHPELDLRQSDAHNLPFADATFDVVASNFGVLHFADPERFFVEAARVLRPGGVLGFTTWADVAGDAFSLLAGAVQRHGVAVTLPDGPPFFRFADAGECRRSLEPAGFTAVTFATHAAGWQLDTPTVLFDAIQEGTVRTAAVLRQQPDDRLAAIREAVAAEVARHPHGDGYRIPMTAHLVTATKPVLPTAAEHDEDALAVAHLVTGGEQTGQPRGTGRAHVDPSRPPGKVVGLDDQLLRDDDGPAATRFGPQ